MNLNNISLPYPVLGISDDIYPLLPDDAVSVNVVNDKRTFTFHICLKFRNQDIDDLITSGYAEYTCEYECSRTMLRRCEKSSKPEFTISVGCKDINGRLNFNCFVSVKRTIQEYENRGFNPDYNGYSFYMEPGDILVAFPQFHYDVDIKYDKLQAAGSFMQIRENEQINEVSFDILGNKIEIQLPSPLYKLYCDPFVKGAKEIIHSSIVLNALTYALFELANKSDDEKKDGTLWERTIFYRLNNEEGLSIEELEDISKIPALAQKLLQQPYLRLFNHLKNTSNNNSQSDDE